MRRTWWFASSGSGGERGFPLCRHFSAGFTSVTHTQTYAAFGKMCLENRCRLPVHFLSHSPQCGRCCRVFDFNSFLTSQLFLRWLCQISTVHVSFFFYFLRANMWPQGRESISTRVFLCASASHVLNSQGAWNNDGVLLVITIGLVGFCLGCTLKSIFLSE